MADLSSEGSPSVPQLLEAAERATATAERLTAAIERISHHLSDDSIGDKARIIRARMVLAGLDQPLGGIIDGKA